MMGDMRKLGSCLKIGSFFTFARRFNHSTTSYWKCDAPRGWTSLDFVFYIFGRIRTKAVSPSQRRVNSHKTLLFQIVNRTHQDLAHRAGVPSSGGYLPSINTRRANTAPAP